MKTKKTSYKFYPAWEFDREVMDLEEQSRNGWQLKKGGCFHSKYYFDDTVQYRHALDFNQDISDPVRYRETFAEQGWEFVNSTFNGWHFFRKVYDPALPEEAYQIYTDTASRQEMAGRWKRLAYILGGLELAVGAINLAMNLTDPHPSGILIGTGSMLLGAILLAGARRIAWPSKNKFLASGWVLLPVLLVFLAALILSIVYNL